MIDRNEKCVAREAVNVLGGRIDDMKMAEIVQIEGPEGEKALACLAVGWRAEWLRRILRLLDDAVEEAVVDLREDKEAALDAAIKKTLQPPGEEK